MSKVIKGSPFDLAGYTEETKFKVIKDYETLKVGDIVTLHEDDGSSCPDFCAEDGRYEYMVMPGNDNSELELYEEPCAPSTKLSLLARIILSDDDLFNGHSQVTINSKLTLEDLTELMTELDQYFEKIGVDSYTEARFSVDGNGSLYAVGYWGEGEHPLGHTDKLLLGWGE